jgi:maleylpyruvate isomerase
MATRPEIDLAGAARAHRRAAAVAATVDDDSVRLPSLLPGWTVGHVLTHLARNADGLTGMVDAAAAGRVGVMYPGGLDQRAADIEAGAARPAADLAADVVAAGAALEAAWSRLTDDIWITGKGRAPLGERAVRDLPFTRWREVEMHLADLGLASFSFEDWDPEYVRRELRLQVLGFRARRPMGNPELPPAALSLSPARRLAWLVGRFAVPQLGDPGPWS